MLDHRESKGIPEKMLKLKLRYLDHLMRRADSLGKTLMGKEEKGEMKDEMLVGITDLMDRSLANSGR